LHNIIILNRSCPCVHCSSQVYTEQIPLKPPHLQVYYLAGSKGAPCSLPESFGSKTVTLKKGLTWSKEQVTAKHTPDGLYGCTSSNRWV